MQNMRTAASMSVSILRDGELWGLISCHHHQPKMIPFPIRGTCDLFARAFSLRLSALQHRQDYERRLGVRAAHAELLTHMTDHGDFAAALVEHPDVLLPFTGASGAAVVTDHRCLLVGQTPREPEVRELSEWLFGEVGEDVFATDSLAAVYPTAVKYKDKASGVLAIAVSKLHPSYVIWFRPEVIQTIKWGGDPNKPVEPTDETASLERVSSRHELALHPRKSFETWRETVRQKSLAWETSEIEGATDLRNAIVGTVLRKAEELAELTDELTRSNKELEAFSYSVSHDLRAPLRHIVGYAEMLLDSVGKKLSERDRRWVTTIIESSAYAGQLVDKLLGYSRLGRAELQISPVDLNQLVNEVVEDVMRDAADRRISWKLAELPSVPADLMMLRMAVRDLISNALKYTRNKEEAVIEVGSHSTGTEVTVWVKDNGVGFDMQYADKLFGVFQRLHRWEDYEGTGIGLANVRRVIERHGGRTWAHAEEGKGASFYFSLPHDAKSEGNRSQNA
jgi:two-component system, chemotaxis family, sensor kinase Cph1